jgi:hypothetical protein
MRYEAMVNRQLNHAMAELERLQARRNGEGTTPDALAFLRNKAGKSFVSNESIKTKSEAKPIFARQTALLVTLRGEPSASLLPARLVTSPLRGTIWHPTGCSDPALCKGLHWMHKFSRP